MRAAPNNRSRTVLICWGIACSTTQGMVHGYFVKSLQRRFASASRRILRKSAELSRSREARPAHRHADALDGYAPRSAHTS